MRRGIYLVVGITLLGIAGWGSYYGVRAAWGQWLYHAAKHGSPARPLEAVLETGQHSLRLHPANYRLCEYAAEAAYNRSFEVGITNAPALREAARFWCERGLALNDYSPYLRWLKSQFLWEENPDAAIANWADYTEWHFWDAYNHAQLCEMLARAGRLAEAEAEFVWVKGSVYEADVKATLEAEKKKTHHSVAPRASDE